MKKLLLFLVVLFFLETVNAQLSFQDNIITDTTSTADMARSVYAIDINGDGNIDVLSASGDGTIAWYENINGQGDFAPGHEISTNADNAYSVFAADLDGDGDIDVLSASILDNKIAWYENIDGQGNFSPEKIITTNVDRAFSVFASDLDGDGDMDVLSASSFDNKIAWYENVDGLGNFGSQIVISSDADGADAVYAADMDEDGDMDILAALFVQDEVVWFENLNGAGDFGEQQTISTLADGANSVYAADLDGDGDMDVLAALKDQSRVVWYENLDGSNSFGGQESITGLSADVLSVFAADLDNDGDMDVLSASLSDDEIAWYENMDGLGNFGEQQIISSDANRAQSVYAADLDGDGDVDVLSASYNDGKIAWYENANGNGSFDAEQIIVADALFYPQSVFSTDLDGDGDIDVLSASLYDDKIAWYENMDGLGGLWNQVVITTDAVGAKAVFSADLNGDGNMDIISGAASKIAWYENLDGLGSFSAQQLVSENIDVAASIYVSDLDSDGDMDILAALSGADQIAWFENIDGTGNFGQAQIITSSADAINTVYATDLDGDGDIDILSASIIDPGAGTGSGKISWFENVDGSGNFSEEKIILDTPLELDSPRSVYASDLDGDGDMDVLSASREDNKIAWYENTDGLGSFGAQKIITTQANQAISVYATDLDGDGDIDVISASNSGKNIAWYENTGQEDRFDDQQCISYFGTGNSLHVNDIDGDGDIDVLSTYDNDNLAWYENLGIDVSVNPIEDDQLNFSVFPSPADDVLFIRSNQTIVHVEIFSSLGQLILSNSSQNKIILSSLIKGVYFCRVTTEDGVFGVEKIIKN